MELTVAHLAFAILCAMFHEASIVVVVFVVVETGPIQFGKLRRRGRTGDGGG